jgi:indolepyruvate ferredoxin oxidoreductase, beta subunit
MPDNGVTNVVFAGLGGQGVIKASDILADAVCRCGFDVKKAEIHGMSQRGGSVTSDVRFGKQVFSPMVPAGQADFLVVLAPDQIDNNKHMLRPGGVLIPCTLIDESKLPSKRSLNIALLGALSVHMAGIEPKTWIDAVKAALPAKVHETNEKAFQFGRHLMEGVPH